MLELHANPRWEWGRLDEVLAHAARVGGAPQLAVQDVRRRPDCRGRGE